MPDRLFDSDEVAAIFRKATEAQAPRQRQLPSGEGLTLAELEDIGRQVGIAPELVARAALSIAAAGKSSSRRFLGLPIGVGRTVEIGRRLTDAEWEQLVVDLRETFDARGTVRTDGSFRQWSNGNLHVLVEPVPGGDRIRMTTVNANARAWMMAGLLITGIAAASGIAAAVTAPAQAHFSVFGEMLVIAAGMFVAGAVRLPGWARLRRAQMEELAGRVALEQPVLPRE